MPLHRNAARYYAQVRAVRALTGADYPTARAAVKALRARDITTATATRAHPRVTARTVRDVTRVRVTRERPDVTSPDRIRSLDDWSEAWEEYDGEYDYWDVDTSADY